MYRWGACPLQPGNLILELKFSALEFCQRYVIRGRMVERILNLAFESLMLPLKFRHVIHQWHVGTSYLLADGAIVPQGLWRVEGIRCCKAPLWVITMHLAAAWDAAHTLGLLRHKPAPAGTAECQGYAWTTRPNSKSNSRA
jgi:hypothetical protein